MDSGVGGKGAIYEGMLQWICKISGDSRIRTFISTHHSRSIDSESFSGDAAAHNLAALFIPITYCSLPQFLHLIAILVNVASY